MTATSSIASLREAGLTILASDERMVAVHLASTFGEVVVDRAGVVMLAADYETKVA